MECDCKFKLTDDDLVPLNRKWAMFWQLKYQVSQEELQKANKGIKRLRNKLDRLQKKFS